MAIPDSGGQKYWYDGLVEQGGLTNVLDVGTQRYWSDGLVMQGLGPLTAPPVSPSAVFFFWWD